MSVPEGKPPQPGRSAGPLAGLVIALQFLTLFPPVVRRIFTPGEVGRSTGYFPLVGLLVGAAGWLLNLLLAPWLPAGVRAVLILIAWTALTGALHFDGFVDACDGLLGGQTPERRLEILRDERVGAFGLAGGVLLLLLKYSTVAALVAGPATGAALVLAPVLGRWTMTLAVYAFPYARPQGLGRAMKDHTGSPQVLLAGGLALILALLLAGSHGIAAFVLATGVAWLGARFALARIPGLTGDVYGAINEIVEAAVLVSFL